MALLLKDGGAEVVTASDGAEAVAKALESNPDVILMDIQMPRLDGYAATAQLRQRGFTNPIIALTAHAMKEVRQQSLAAGCSDYLTKPIRIDELVKKVSGQPSRHRPP